MFTVVEINDRVDDLVTECVVFITVVIDERVDEFITEGVVFTTVEIDDRVDDVVTEGVVLTTEEIDDRVEDLATEGFDVEDGVKVPDTVVEIDNPVVNVVVALSGLSVYVLETLMQ